MWVRKWGRTDSRQGNNVVRKVGHNETRGHGLRERHLKECILVCAAQRLRYRSYLPSGFDNRDPVIVFETSTPVSVGGNWGECCV